MWRTREDSLLGMLRWPIVTSCESRHHLSGFLVLKVACDGPGFFRARAPAFWIVHEHILIFFVFRRLLARSMAPGAAAGLGSRPVHVPLPPSKIGVRPSAHLHRQYSAAPRTAAGHDAPHPEVGVWRRSEEHTSELQSH